MRFSGSIFGALLKPIDRRGFRALVRRQGADAYDKSFRSWDHLPALLFVQFTGACSLRQIEIGFNAQANHHHHHHLGCGALSRSTLGERCEGGASNGRIRGLKLHVVPDEAEGLPVELAITPANVNDVTIHRDGGETFDIITNDTTRSALEIALCYKARWGIELYFKWIKQNLSISRFLGRSDNAIRLQLLAAMIAYVLLARFLHSRRDLAQIRHPPACHPARPFPPHNQTQFAFP